MKKNTHSHTDTRAYADHCVREPAACAGICSECACSGWRDRPARASSCFCRRQLQAKAGVQHEEAVPAASAAGDSDLLLRVQELHALLFMRRTGCAPEEDEGRRRQGGPRHEPVPEPGLRAEGQVHEPGPRTHGYNCEFVPVLACMGRGARLCVCLCVRLDFDMCSLCFDRAL